MCVSTHTHIAHTHTHTLSQRGAGGEKSVANAQLFFYPSDQLMCSPLTKTVALMWTVHDTPSSLSLSLCLPSVSFFLSCSPCSLRFISPFHTASSYICSFQSCKWLQVLFPPLHATALPPLTLSLCPFLPSQPPTNAFFHRSCCSLSTPWSRPSHKLCSAVKKNVVFFLLSGKNKGERKTKTDEERGERALSVPLLSLGTMVALNCLATWPGCILLIGEAWVTLQRALPECPLFLDILACLTLLYGAGHHAQCTLQ